MIYGLDLLGLARFDTKLVRELAKKWPKGYWLGVFSDVDGFGDAREHAKIILSGGRCPGIRVQGSWRDDHNFDDLSLGNVLRDALRWNAIGQEFTNVAFEYSFACEHNLKNPDKYHEIVERDCPKLTPVNAPDTGALSRKYKNEIHGTKPALRGKYNFSFDGTDATNSDMAAFRKRHLRSDKFFLWVPQFNGRMSTNDATPRPARKAWPSMDLIESVAYLANKVGPVKLPSKFLWKTHSEQHNVPPAARELKPVLICPVRTDAFELRRNGRKIATLAYYDEFVDGRHRYYLKEWGYKYSEKSKNQLYDLVADGKRYGKVNCAFRSGEFKK